jgi:CheY-like chemotaxis protein/anti-sigma regulatory factor (Ser/Thr protein kinase)
MHDRPTVSLRSGRKLRVLVADDQELNRKLLTAILRLEGHTVLEAVDGEEAVTLFERERPDLVLMDVIMPVMDGYEATRRIKRLAGAAFVPVIFLTSLTSDQALADALAAGADDYLGKPFQRAVLVARIATAERLRGATAHLPAAPAAEPSPSEDRRRPLPPLISSAPTAAWRWRLELCGATLRALDPIAAALALIERCGFPAGHRENLYTVLAELCNNAIDHGVLRLDSALKAGPEGFAAFCEERQRRLEALTEGAVTIEMCHRPRADGGDLAIRVTDSGSGFDHERVLACTRASLATNSACCGRGVALVLSLCESLRYDCAGTSAEAVYRWRHPN